SLEHWFAPAARKLGWRTEFSFERYARWAQQSAGMRRPVVAVLNLDPVGADIDRRVAVVAPNAGLAHGGRDGSEAQQGSDRQQTVHGRYLMPP
ncbi:MAG TPA: hypothetical protein VLK25_02920, partial [Allosphingosinicella sp.]|nr:hypothetical protein [Allosphingosinicella sp.]